MQAYNTNYFCYPNYQPPPYQQPPAYHPAYQQPYNPFYAQPQQEDEMAKDEANYTVSYQDTKQYIQFDDKTTDIEKVIQDHMLAFNEYPFNVNSLSEIKELKFKVSNVVIRITENQFISDKPIQIEIRDNCFCVWTATTTEHRTLTTKGQSIIDGYNMDAFDGGQIKTSRKFEHNLWNHGPLKLNNLTVNGDNCTINIGTNVFSSNSKVDIFGKCKFNFTTSSHFDKLDVFATYGDLDFGKCDIDHVNLELEGNGTVKGITVNQSAKLKIVGDGNISLTKGEDTEVSEEIFGGGSINYG